MAAIGYTLSCEEHGPRELVAYARRAEEAGFEFAGISDHFHPWVDKQGNSPFVWAVLGGVAEVTERLAADGAVDDRVVGRARLGAERPELLGPRRRPGGAGDLMAALGQLGNEAAADRAARANHENSHDSSSFHAAGYAAGLPSQWDRPLCHCYFHWRGCTGVHPRTRNTL